MGNALACAAANASLDLFEREDRLGQAKAVEGALEKGLAPCRDLPGVRDVRVRGAIGVVELERLERREELQSRFMARGVWVRPIRNIVYLTPALNVEADDLAHLTDSTGQVLKEHLQHPQEAS